MDDMKPTNGDANTASHDKINLEVIIGKLDKDLREASKRIGREEARFLVDTYYQLQKDRIRSGLRVRAAEEHTAATVLSWVEDQSFLLEKRVATMLDIWSEAHVMGPWLRSVHGVGPVISAGLLANLDIEKAPTVGHFWAISGLDPSKTWNKGEKRPWNASLKRLCCAPGTAVTTKDGPKLIECIKVGNEVLTHRGRWRQVTGIMRNEYNGGMVRLRAHGLAGFGPAVTPNHPILTKQMRVCQWQDSDGRERFRANPRKRRVTQIEDSAWAEVEMRIAGGERGTDIAKATGVCQSMVSKIRHGYVRQPTVDATSWSRADAVSPGWRLLSPTPPLGGSIPHIVLADLPNLHNPAIRRDVEVNHDVARLIGLFLGDGHTAKNRVVWSFGLHEGMLSSFVIATLRNCFGLRAAEKVTHNMRVVRCESQQLQQWFDIYAGKFAHHKHVPFGWLQADKLILVGLLRGLFESDGCTNESASYASVNWHLAQSVAQILRTLRIQATAVPRSNVSILPGGRKKECQFYVVQPTDVTKFFEVVMDEMSEPIGSTAVAEWRDEGAWHTARDSITIKYDGYVYNLEVDEDHSYVADGVAVHNCFLIGESFMKSGGSEKSYYGPVYKQRKDYEWAKNLRGDYADQCRETLAKKKFIDSPPRRAAKINEGATCDEAAEVVGAKKWYEGAYNAADLSVSPPKGAKAPVGGGIQMLPPGRIQLRAKRYAVKSFLSDFHAVWHFVHFGVLPPKPFAIDILGHGHWRKPYGCEGVLGMSEAYDCLGPVRKRA